MADQTSQARGHLERGDELAWIQRKTRAALKEYRQALILCPTMAEAHWRIGQIHFFAKNRKVEEASREFKEAVRLAPGWSEGHLWYANALEELGQDDLAIAEYKVAIELNPNDSRHYASLGYSLSKLGRYAEAIDAFQQSIRLMPAYGEMSVRLGLADALLGNGQVPEAIRQWEVVAAMEVVWPYERSNVRHARKMLAKYA